MRHRIPDTAQLSHERGEPRACYAAWRQRLTSDEALLLVDFEFSQYWLEDVAPRTLTAIYYVHGDQLRVAVTGQPLAAEPLEPAAQFRRWTEQHHLVSFDPAQALRLEPAFIAKPWGREVWYTGVERRGVCDFARADGRTPIPWLQAVVPGNAAGVPGEPLLLLKILDPSPDPRLGELYFELHEEKREAYVVTGIDPVAWPGGVGYMRYGFDPALLASYADDDRFRADYLAAVQAYETRRRALDAQSERGICADPRQLADEQTLRGNMNRFTRLLPLRVGDVIEVPLLLPHALQHGVRVVEFQTPSYERKILSFGQQVLTQAHWDTPAAVARMKLTAPSRRAPVLRHHSESVTVEEVVDFPDFEVVRVTVQPGARWQFQCGASYCLVITVSGILDLADAVCTAEQALLLPRFWAGLLAAPEAAPALVFLLARPRS